MHTSTICADPPAPDPPGECVVNSDCLMMEMCSGNWNMETGKLQKGKCVVNSKYTINNTSNAKM